MIDKDGGTEKGIQNRNSKEKPLLNVKLWNRHIKKKERVVYL